MGLTKVAAMGPKSKHPEQGSARDGQRHTRSSQNGPDLPFADGEVANLSALL